MIHLSSKRISWNWVDVVKALKDKSKKVFRRERMTLRDIGIEEGQEDQEIIMALLFIASFVL